MNLAVQLLGTACVSLHVLIPSRYTWQVDQSLLVCFGGGVLGELGS